MSSHATALLLDSITLPAMASMSSASTPISMQEFHTRLQRLEDDALKDAVIAFAEADAGRELLVKIYTHSPYLSQLMHKHFTFFAAICHYGLDWATTSITQWLDEPAKAISSTDELMQHLRIAKSQCALVTAIADLGGAWKLEDVTGFLSLTAEKCLSLAVDFLLLNALQRKELLHIDPENPSLDSGLVVLGMGKLGAYELNYSSDIDIILLYDSDNVRYDGKQTAQQCFNRITRELVRIMQERTSHGYVFRTDIRLRPDPASTPPALSINAAMAYYETVGQNWERAAMIKARPVAGDLDAAEAFLKELTPFIWRRNLDFAAIADIHSIKRQIDYKTGGEITVAGHNLKLGAGGIREIEFFVQVQQLIWGGRTPNLRHRGTCEMLSRLAQAERISSTAAEEMQHSYHFLRRMEHRVQMQRDQQSHSLPSAKDALTNFAAFADFGDLESFEAALLMHMHNVRKHYVLLYGVDNSLGNEGNLSFTGVDLDPGTVKTLHRMGFKQAETICDIVANWHRGHRRSTRNKRAREILTELTPDLLKAFASTVNPDVAFLKFDEFLAKLPAGVQIFSLFANNPQLLRLIAMLMGSAPRLAEILSRNSYLLDAVLTGAFYQPLPDKTALENELQSILAARGEFEDFLNIIAQFKNEKAFQAGIQLMNKIADCEQVGNFLSALAEVILNNVLEQVENEFSEIYGTILGSELAIVALGKLGAKELTFSSDLDLIFIYRNPSPDQLSDGNRPFTASVYFNRFCQRLLGALTALNREGRLYEIDTRLRPLGSDGPLAASFEAYSQYFETSAWTFEYMALTRARAIISPTALKADIEYVIHNMLTSARDAQRIRADVHAMRQKVEQGLHTTNPWNIKYIRGGLMDIDFIAQYFQLLHGNRYPEILSPSSQAVFVQLELLGILDKKTAEILKQGNKLMLHLLHLLRLCSDGSLDEATAPEGLTSLLADQLGFTDFSLLKSTLIKTENKVYNIYKDIFTGDES
ncbi:MAG: bifunctional [glutamine synthetase] adenylyltransferase/[glutamine synthetase]-adenylyl-L-tyrosine phosphorylase [Alphaproteobacteria bacterium]|nr:bifunctional [glutamine synthetase] adenylyltransferase/[glutamine synthetase]-adenylyl-L-tyrosine phosphorylase [Alphaproteobacteria bacterium]